jgi:hypothetical protein
VSYGADSSSPFDSSNTAVTRQSSIVDDQAETEASIMSGYEASGTKTLDDPCIVQNPYGTAPLTALVIFDTASSCDVTVTVHGKTDDCDVSYTVSGESTRHEVPVYGLYARLQEHGHHQGRWLDAGHLYHDRRAPGRHRDDHPHGRQRKPAGGAAPRDAEPASGHLRQQG